MNNKYDFDFFKLINKLVGGIAGAILAIPSTIVLNMLRAHETGSEELTIFEMVMKVVENPVVAVILSIPLGTLAGHLVSCSFSTRNDKYISSGTCFYTGILTAFITAFFIGFALMFAVLLGYIAQWVFNIGIILLCVFLGIVILIIII